MSASGGEGQPDRSRVILKRIKQGEKELKESKVLTTIGPLKQTNNCCSGYYSRNLHTFLQMAAAAKKYSRGSILAVSTTNSYQKYMNSIEPT